MFNHFHMFEAAIKAAPGVSFRGSISARRPGVVPMAVLAPELASKNACSCLHMLAIPSEALAVSMPFVPIGSRKPYTLLLDHDKARLN